MSRCVIFAALPPGEVPEISPDDFIIACDRGLLYARQAQIEPHLVLGDFDSWDGDVGDVPARRFPVEKDDTDTMLAVKEGLARGFTDFYLCGTLGGRLDHTLANVQALRFLLKHKARGVLTGEGERMTVVAEEEKTFPCREGYSFSVLALSERAEGVTLKGFYYPLEDGVLENAFPLGHGNRITGEKARVSVRRGAVLVAESKE